ncbi:MAG: transcription termination factor Rho [Planctomycetes bacterium]|nr:transcription termination factor Rho [Planctomycetota bacterium]
MASKKNAPPRSDPLPFGAGTFDTPPEKPAAAARAPKASQPQPEARSESRAPEPRVESRAPEARPERRAPEARAEGAEGEERGRPRRRRRGRGRGRGERTEDAGKGASATGAPTQREPNTERAATGEREPAEREHEDFAREEREYEPRPNGAAPAVDGDDGAQDSESDAPPQSGERGFEQGPVDPSAPPRRSGRAERRRRWQERRRRRRLGLPLDDLAPQGEGGGTAAPHAAPSGPGAPHSGQRHAAAHPPREPRPPPLQEEREVEGMLVVDFGNHGELRMRAADYLPSKDDVHVAPWQLQKFNLREGALVKGHVRRGQGRNRWELTDVLSVDGKDPRELRNVPVFKNLVTIDPDFHYAMGDASGEVSLKVIDLLCPIGRGQRGLIVAPPRSGKTILLRQIAKAVEATYPDVHLMVLLVDERPEEATEWKRSVAKGEVFVSTNDEPAKKHVELAEVVWRRARHLVELGQDVLLLIDSLTRLGRAANNVWGNSGKTMSGGIDTRALERPKALFGSARNTEEAGSLTILGTALIETGSKMDQYIFEEFKGTGNMELVLSRKLSDRRIFPAIDLERSGTRKDEKLHSAKRLARVNTLRRVLMRMHFAEAMELLIGKLEDVDKIDDFLMRFDVDPDAGEDKQTVSPVRMRW